MPLDRTILNLGVSVLFCLMHACKTKSCIVNVLRRLIRVYTVCQSPKNAFGQIHWTNNLKVKGCQVCFICCKFTKVPGLWQTVLTLNRWAVLRLSDLDLHCLDGVARSDKKELRDPN